MKSFAKVLGIIVAVLLCIVTLGVQYLTYASYSASDLLKDDAVTEIIGEMDYSDLISADNAATKDIYTALEQIGYSQDTVSNLLNSASMKTILAEIAIDYKNAVLNDETYQSLTQTEASALVSTHIDKILKESGISGYTDLTKTIASGLLGQFVMSVSQLMPQLPEFQAKVFSFNLFELKPSFLLSQTGQYVLIGVNVMLLVLIALLLGSFGKGLKWYGIVTIVSGASLLAGTLLMNTALMKLLFTIPSDYAGILSPVFESARPGLLLSGGIGLVAGVLETTVGSLLRKKHKKTA